MSYNWNDSWIWKYESIWSIIEKFKYSNELTDTDIKKLLKGKVNKTDVSKGKRKELFNVLENFHYSKNGINPYLINKLLDRDILNEKNHEILDFLDVFHNYGNINKYMYKKFRYCDKCIKNGYHSWIHQLSFFNHCIFHGKKLHTKCPGCNKEYEYRFNSSKTGFACDCGYNYLNNTSFKQLIKIWKGDSIYTNKNIGIIDKETSLSCLFTSFEYIKNLYLDNNTEYYIDSINLKNNLYEYNQDILCNTKFKPILYGSIIPNHIEERMISDDLGYFMMNEYVNIYKSIARQIRKSIDKKGFKVIFTKQVFILSDCLNRSDLSYKDIQDTLFAYIMWRKEIEGHEKYYDVHSKVNIGKSMSMKEYLRRNISETNIYKYIFVEWRSYINMHKIYKNSPFYDYGILKSSLEKIVSKILLKYYNDWLKYIRNNQSLNPNKKVDFKTIIPIEFNNIMIAYENQTNTCYLVNV